MRSVAITALICGVVLVGLRAGHTNAAVTNCGTASIGPGAVGYKSTGGGARCLLAAYLDHCRQARFRLSLFGIDTVATRDFRLVMSSGRCAVAVTLSFRVVPQPAHVTGQGTCARLRAIGRSVVAESCKGHGVPATFSLTASAP